MADPTASTPPAAQMRPVGDKAEDSLDLEKTRSFGADSQSLGEFHTLAGAVHQGRVVGRSFAKGDRIDRYEVLQLIGSGGFSHVYRVRHRYLDHEFALKTLKETGAHREQAERFLREARTLALLNHPSVLRVYDANISSTGVPYIITQLLRGETLRAKIKSGIPMTPARVTDLIEEVAQVLILQERLGVIHRDIKPSNIFEREGGAFCLFDYTSIGLVADKSRQHEAFASVDTAITASGAPIMGTPIYMAPEQFEGHATNQSDLFCLGMTAWECLVGRPPRPPGLSLLEFSKVAAQPVPMEEVEQRAPKEVATVLNHLLAPDGAQRYQSAVELLADVQDYRYEGRPPSGPLKGNCFIAIPYARGFRKTYEAIAKAVVAVHLRARRMDELIFVSDIWGQIEQEISGAVVVVADFSRMGWWRQPNPNVITEAAHARAVDKPLIILTRDAPETLPFDWRHMPILRYRDTPEGLAALGMALATKLRQLIKGAGEPTDPAHSEPLS